MAREISDKAVQVEAKGNLPAFIVTGCSTDTENGELYPIKPIFAYSEEDAQKKMETAYFEKLKGLGLNNNGACDENDDSAPGGFVSHFEAGIYNYAEFANDALIMIASFVVFPYASA